MTELEFFKCGNNRLNAIDDLNRQVSEFIADKTVINTNVVINGAYLYIYVFYTKEALT